MATERDRIIFYTDGASRGNPGDSAWAYILLSENGEQLASQSGYIGRGTNNQAEYFAVIRALQRASEITTGTLEGYSDSQLVVNQITGKWKVKNPELNRLCNRAKELQEDFVTVSFKHVPRSHEMIAHVDGMCNDTLDSIQSF
ncbi:ribonuclease HI family protein [Candidatus Bipolaricaulota bacterium]|nr:ribonuclease HI family protein [Candidatus Bipolaricaulota bacterium]